MQGNRKNFGKRKAETIRKSEYCRRMAQGRSVKEKRMIRREIRKAAVRKGNGNTYDYNTTDAANAGGMEAAMAAVSG